MSGPKCGRIRLTPQELLRQQFSQTKQWLDTQRTRLAVSDIENDLAEARKESKRLRTVESRLLPQEKLQKLLDEFDRNREDLTLMLKEKGRLLVQADQAVKQLRDELARSGSRLSGPMTPVEMATASHALEGGRTRAAKALTMALAAERSLKIQSREMKLWIQKLDSLVSPKESLERTNQAPSLPALGESRDLEKEIRMEAVCLELQKRLALLAEPAALDRKQAQAWLKQPQKTEEFETALKNIRTQLDAKRMHEAQIALDSAEAIKDSIQDEVEKNKAAVERNQRIAEAIMQTLCDRHYNTPKFGELKENDPLSGVQIRADVPNRDGKGNLRVDINFDGSTVFEVENIPEGEEKLCREVIGDVGKAMESMGMELEMNDWGRATVTGVTKGGASGVSFVQKQTEQERSREIRGKL